MYNFSRGGASEDPYSYNMDGGEDEEQGAYDYEYDYDYDEDDQEYNYEEEEDEDEVPLYMAKAEKTGGIGGLGLNRQNSLGQSTATRAQSASGGSFYGGKEKQETQKKNSLIKDTDPNPYSYGGGDYGYGPDTDEEEELKKKKPQSAPSKGKIGGLKKGKKDIEPKRFAIKYNPPTIILEYLVPTSGKLYHHKMKLQKLQKDTKNQDAVDYLKKKHYMYFMGGKIEDKQIESLVDKLKKRLPADGATTSTTTKGKTSSSIASKYGKQSEKQKKGQYNYDDYDMGDDDDFNYY